MVRSFNWVTKSGLAAALSPAIAAVVLVSSNMLVAAPTLPGTDAEILAAQNRERVGLGLTPMRWDNDLAASAEQWAQHLAATGEFRHSPENGANPQGENIWAGTRGAYSPDAMVGAWIQEKQLFKPGRFPDNSVTQNWQAVAHYTQIVWRDTQEVGCARASNTYEDILVCRYSHPGNVIGQRPF